MDPLPDALLRGAGATVAYRIEIFNEKERSAGLSAPALAASGAAPPTVEHLAVAATREGALLQWRPEDAADAVEVIRLQVGTPAKAEKQAGSGQAAPREPGAVRLRAAGGGTNGRPFLTDAGGLVDATAVRGNSYSYAAQRIRRVVMDGATLELRSAASPPVTVAMRDVFPPGAPVGLEAIADDVEGVRGVDLSWTPNTEDDLAGYLLYRQEGTSSQAVQITPSLVLQPVFRDVSVAAGRTYVYTVRAIDRDGNRSAPSAVAQEMTPAP